MFVIPCKFSKVHNYVIQLVKDIRQHHPSERIVVVDSDSEDRSYFPEITPYGVIIEDIHNRMYGIGAFWHCYRKFSEEQYYYVLHDTMRVKANLDSFKGKDLTIIATFNRMVSTSFNKFSDKINADTQYKYKHEGKGVMGPIFMLKRTLADKLAAKGFDKIVPTNKAECGCMEGAMGFVFEAEGYDVEKCSLYGDILALESPGGRSGPYPHNTSWQHPIEKFYASRPTKDKYIATEQYARL